MHRIKVFIQFTSIVILIFTISCKNDSKQPIDLEDQGSKEVKEIYGTGETSRIYTRVNGKIEGKMTDYYPSGALKGERYFKDNKQVGKTIVYFENGKVKEVQYYTDGLRNGGDTIFYEDGSLKFVSEFKNDKKNGYLRKWCIEGDLIYEAKFALDTLVEVGGEPIK